MSFIPEVGLYDSCWASFIPEVARRCSWWATFVSPRYRLCPQLPFFLHPRAPQPGPPVPPAPSTPVGPSMLRTIHITTEPTPNSACNSPTTLSNPEIRSLELQRFLTLLKLHPIELHATFLGRAPPPPMGTAAWPSCALQSPQRPHTNGTASLFGGSTRRLEAQLRPPSTPSDTNGPPSAHKPPKPGISTDKGIIGFT